MAQGMPLCVHSVSSQIKHICENKLNRLQILVLFLFDYIRPLNRDICNWLDHIIVNMLHGRSRQFYAMLLCCGNSQQAETLLMFFRPAFSLQWTLIAVVPVSSAISAFYVASKKERSPPVANKTYWTTCSVKAHTCLSKFFQEPMSVRPTTRAWGQINYPKCSKTGLC